MAENTNNKKNNKKGNNKKMIRKITLQMNSY